MARARKRLLPHGSQIPLAAFFEQTYLPLKLRHRAADYADHFRGSINWLRRAMMREPLVGDLNRAAVVAALKLLVDSGIGFYRTRDVRKKLCGLWAFARRLGFVADYDPPPVPRRYTPRPLPEALLKQQKDPPHNKLPAELPAEPGTLRRFFDDVHRPQTLLGACEWSIVDYRRMLSALRTFLEREPLVSELSDVLAAAFFESLTERGLSAGTVNRYRANLFATWRSACRAGLVEKWPTVPKLPTCQDAPDAWTSDEARRLVAATDRFNLRPPIAGIPADRFWRALLLICWYTALRRRSLFSIRRSDVDLERGTIAVRGVGVKTRRGKRFRVGPNAIEAIRAIWTPERDLLFPRLPSGGEFDLLLELAGIRPSDRSGPNKFHKLRRTVATQAAIHAGMAAAISLLDHSSAEMTRRYIDPTQLPDNDATKFLPSLQN